MALDLALAEVKGELSSQELQTTRKGRAFKLFSKRLDTTRASEGSVLWNLVMVLFVCRLRCHRDIVDQLRRNFDGHGDLKVAFGPRSQETKASAASLIATSDVCTFIAT